MPIVERHSIIIIINGLTKMKANATTGQVVDLITNVNAADALVDANWTALSHNGGTVQQLNAHKWLGVVQQFVEQGVLTVTSGTNVQTNGAVAATIDDLNSQIAEIL